jgi:hypothetical protein
VSKVSCSLSSQSKPSTLYFFVKRAKQVPDKISSYSQLDRAVSKGRFCISEEKGKFLTVIFCCYFWPIGST